MINTNHLCMECMKNKGEAEICPYCNYRDDGLQTTPYLATKTWLMDRYLVGKVTTFDAEGITYIGWDNILQSPVIVREFFPEGLCVRAENGLQVTPVSSADFSQCLGEFLDLHRALGRMRELGALFPVYDIFESNGTAYAVSEYTESITLNEFLHRNRESLTFEQARTLLLPAVATLSALHSADIIHGGISPDTLYVGKDGKLRFGGFAGSQLRFARGALKTGLFAGYAAIEQYGFDGKAGPQTDVYAFAATLYRVLSGAAPMSAKDRVNNDVFVIPATVQQKMPEHAAEALTNALQLMPDARTATIERFRSEFSATPAIREEKKSTALPLDDEETPTEEPKSKTALYAIIAMLATLVVFLGIFTVVDLTWNVFGVFSSEEASSAPSLLVISSQPTPSVDTQSQLTRKVNNFVGQSYEAAVQNFTSYNITVQYRVYSDQYEKGTIISQSPEAGTEIPLESKEAQPVTVVVSLGSGDLKVPTVSGLTYAQAIEKLWQAGFSYDSISTNVENPGYDYVVTKVAPEAGSKCNVYDAKVILYVEKPVTSNVEVPTTSEDNREVSSIPEAPSTPSKPAQ